MLQVGAQEQPQERSGDVAAGDGVEVAEQAARVGPVGAHRDDLVVLRLLVVLHDLLGDGLDAQGLGLLLGPLQASDEGGAELQALQEPDPRLAGQHEGDSVASVDGAEVLLLAPAHRDLLSASVDIDKERPLHDQVLRHDEARVLAHVGLDRQHRGARVVHLHRAHGPAGSRVAAREGLGDAGLPRAGDAREDGEALCLQGEEEVGDELGRVVQPIAKQRVEDLRERRGRSDRLLGLAGLHGRVGIDSLGELRVHRASPEHGLRVGPQERVELGEPGDGLHQLGPRPIHGLLAGPARVEQEVLARLVVLE